MVEVAFFDVGSAFFSQTWFVIRVQKAPTGWNAPDRFGSMERRSASQFGGKVAFERFEKLFEDVNAS